MSNYKCKCWHGAHCGISCLVSGCECRECECLECMPPVASQDRYEVYPEDDGTDQPRNPYSQV